MLEPKPPEIEAKLSTIRSTMPSMEERAATVAAGRAVEAGGGRGEAVAAAAAAAARFTAARAGDATLTVTTPGGVLFLVLLLVLRLLLLLVLVLLVLAAGCSADCDCACSGPLAPCVAAGWAPCPDLLPELARVGACAVGVAGDAGFLVLWDGACGACPTTYGALLLPAWPGESGLNMPGGKPVAEFCGERPRLVFWRPLKNWGPGTLLEDSDPDPEFPDPDPGVRILTPAAALDWTWLASRFRSCPEAWWLVLSSFLAAGARIGGGCVGRTAIRVWEEACMRTRPKSCTSHESRMRDMCSLSRGFVAAC